MSAPGFYDRLLLPFLIELACGHQSVTEERLKVVPLAHGRVLELGLGTGLNLPHYDASKVSVVVGADPAAQMAPRARKRAAASKLKVELLQVSAEHLPVEDASFDSAVSTYSLCSIPDPLAALKEVRRVLKPGGALFFCEHGRAPDEANRRWQDRLDKVWPFFAGGCHFNRNIPGLLQAAGFSISNLEEYYAEGPKPMTYFYRGAAVPLAK